jgi:Biopolymer transport protein
MKMRLVIVMLALLTVGCHATAGPATKGETITPNLDSNLTRTYTWAETGLEITLLQGWRRDDDGSSETERWWTTKDSCNFKVSVSTATSTHTIEDDTAHYYETQKGSEDLRYINVDGLRGVHFLRSQKSVSLKPQDEKWIFWSAQRMWGDQRQLITVVLTTPTESFEKNSHLLYSLLASLKFDSNKSTAATSEMPATDQSRDVIVSIPTADEFYLGKRKTERAQIADAVDKLLRDRPVDKQTWYIKAVHTISCETVLKLRNEIAALGYERVGLVTDTATHANPEAPSSHPKKSSNVQTNQEDRNGFNIHLGLSETGRLIIQLNETEVSPNELSARAHAFVQSYPGKGVIITVAPTVSYGALTGIIHSLKADGVDTIGIDLEKK